MNGTTCQKHKKFSARLSTVYVTTWLAFLVFSGRGTYMNMNMDHTWGFSYFHLCTMCGININSLQIGSFDECNSSFRIFLSLSCRLSSLSKTRSGFACLQS